MSETWKLHHVGIPVPDLDRAIEDYQTLGNATFQPEFLIDSAQMQEYLVYGKTPDPTVKTRGAMGTLGPLGIELLQPLQGHTVHKELLDSVRYRRRPYCVHRRRPGGRDGHSGGEGIPGHPQHHTQGSDQTQRGLHRHPKQVQQAHHRADAGPLGSIPPRPRGRASVAAQRRRCCGGTRGTLLRCRSGVHPVFQRNAHRFASARQGIEQRPRVGAQSRGRL